MPPGKTSQKRKLDGKNDGSSKRRKVQNGKPQPKLAKRAVPMDSLPWRPVDLPEMFDDAEGFFGLEEVDGVDVVREGGLLKFVTAGPTIDDTEEFGGFEDAPESLTASQNDQEEAGEGPEIESEVHRVSKKPKSPKERKKSEKEKKGPKSDEAVKEEESLKHARKKTPAGDAELAPISFAALGETDQEPEEEVDISDWVPVGLSEELLSSVSRLRFPRPTSIQAAAVPEILAGHDVIGKASTGSGKTLAFGIPIVERWLSLQDAEEKRREKGGASVDNDAKVPIALVLSPTRELAHQLTSHIKDLCSGLPLSPYVCSVTGGLAVQKQQRQLEKADIVVGTPGRLWEVLSSSKKLITAFRGIRFLVIDEADRLLSEGHFKDAEEILGALDRTEHDEDDDRPGLVPRQTLVFSATLNKGLQQKLAGKGRFDLATDAQSMEYLLKRLKFREAKPKFIDVNPVSQMATGLKEGLVECGAMEKDLYLYALLMMHPTKRALVFANSISSVRRLAPMLQNLALPALPLHSQMPQKARLRSVERFSTANPNKGSILIATDVAARGLDIPGIDAVIHYHVPRTADAYVHRSGRTARAESSGISILICGPEEVTPTRRLVAKVHAKAASKGGKRASMGLFVNTIDLDRRLVGRLKERVTLAKRLADATLAKEKGGKEDEWVKNAAEELGVDYDSEELEGVGSWSGRGSGRKSKQEADRSLSKGEAAQLRARLKELLSKRVNAGVSERYIANGSVDIDQLLSGAKGEFLGRIEGLGVAPLVAAVTAE